MTNNPEVSHGRGGAGNITADGTQYVDGEITRQGEVGTQHAGAFSTGRGGEGNIGDVGKPRAPRTDSDVVPAEAIRVSAEAEDRHVGRGGAANVQLKDGHANKRAKVTDSASLSAPSPQQPVSLADKLKRKIFGRGKN